MKKKVVMILVLSLLLSLAACGKKGSGKASPGDAETASASSAASQTYFEQNGFQFSPAYETQSNQFFAYISEIENDIYNRVEFDDLKLVQNNAEFTFKNATIQDDPYEEGYVYIVLELEHYYPFKMIDGGHVLPWFINTVTSGYTVCDYNTGIKCRPYVYGVTYVDNGLDKTYDIVATYGDASKRDRDFYYENMRYTDIEYNGDVYSIGVMTEDELIEQTSWTQDVSDSTGQTFTKHDKYLEKISINAPKDCKLFLALSKEGANEAMYEDRLAAYNAGLAGKDVGEGAEENVTSDDIEGNKRYPLLGPVENGKTYQVSDFICIDVDELIKNAPEP